MIKIHQHQDHLRQINGGVYVNFYSVAHLTYGFETAEIFDCFFVGI